MALEVFTMRAAWCILVWVLSEVFGLPSLDRPELRTSQSTPPSSKIELDLLNITLQQRQAAFSSSDSLLEPEPKGQACYAAIYDQVKVGCARESDMGPNERMLASVLLTLCDLRASGQSVPWECDNSQRTAEAGSKADVASLTSCVEALSRSTRHWSSYAGYLREIPQMCFAMQRWKSIDRARKIYKTATKEKIELLKMLHQYTRNAAEANDAERNERQTWLHNLSLAHDQMRDDLKILLDDISSVLERNSQNDQQLVQYIHNIEPYLQQAAVSVMQQYSEATRQYSEELLHELSARLQQSMIHYNDHTERALHEHLSSATKALVSDFAAPLDTMQQLATMLGLHTDGLRGTLQEQHGLVSALTSASQGMVTRQQLHNEQLNEQLNALRELQTNLRVLNKDMNETHTELGTILRSQHSTSSLLGGVYFIIERVVIWSLGEFERWSGLGLGNVTAWRYFRWMLLFWPLSLKLKAFVTACAPVVKAILSASVLLSMVIRGCLRPCFFVFAQLRRRFPQPDRDREAFDHSDDVRVDMESKPAADWVVVSNPDSRPVIPSRCSVPYEQRVSASHIGRMTTARRSSRIHCPSATF